MKRPWKRAAALLLAGAMCLGLGGCGGTEESGSGYTTLAQELGYGYVAAYSELDGMELDNITNVSTVQGTLHVSGEYYDKDYLDRLYALDSGGCTEIPMPELYHDDYADEYMLRLSVCPDGSGYWAVIDRYVYYGGAEETGEMEEGSWFFLRKYDMSGQELLETDLQELADTDGLYISCMAQDGAGVLYMAVEDTVRCFGPDGTRLEDIAGDSLWLQSMAVTEEGTVLASVFRYGSVTGDGVVRLENGTMTDLAVEGLSAAGSTTLYSGSGDTVLLSDGVYLYALDASDGTLTTLLSWMDSDISGDSVGGVAADGEDAVVVLLSGYDRREYTYSFELGVLTKTPAEELPERAILTLGAVYLDETVEEAVVEFNRKSDTYRVVLVDYSDASDGADQLDMDIISGDCPDLLCLGDASGSVQQYIRLGVLADLTPLMEADPEFSVDNLLSGPLQSFQSDGKLYGLPYCFGLEMVYASARLTGELESWTYEDMAEIAAGLDGDVDIMSGTTRTGLLSALVQYNREEFVDEDSAACNFETEGFETLLALCARLPERTSGSLQNGEYVDEYQQLQQVQAGETLAASGWVTNSDGVRQMYNLYSEENGFMKPGYPTGSGNGAVLSVYGSLAISAASKNQEGAWEFLKTLLSDDVQTNMWELPVTVSAMDTVLADAMERDSFTDPDTGETVYYDSVSYWIGDTQYTVDVLSEVQAEAFKELVNGAAVAGSCDANLVTIVTEEAATYFAGDKTAAEAASLIQSRVAVYLEEGG